MGEEDLATDLVTEKEQGVIVGGPREWPKFPDYYGFRREYGSGDRTDSRERGKKQKFCQGRRILAILDGEVGGNPVAVFPGAEVHEIGTDSRIKTTPAGARVQPQEKLGNIPFEDNQFDLILVSPRIDDEGPTIDELVRVLKLGGEAKVKPFKSRITPDMIEKLEKRGFEIQVRGNMAVIRSKRLQG